MVWDCWFNTLADIWGFVLRYCIKYGFDEVHTEDNLKSQLD